MPVRLYAHFFMSEQGGIPYQRQWRRLHISQIDYIISIVKLHIHVKWFSSNFTIVLK